MNERTQADTSFYTWTVPSAAIKPIDKVEERQPVNRKTFVSALEARSLLEKDVATAEALGRKFLAESPDDPDATYLLGAALRRTGRLVEAKALLEPLTESQPQMGRAWYELGALLAALGQRNTAARALLRAIDFDWMHREAWFALGDVLPFPPYGEDQIDDRALSEAVAAQRERRFLDCERILRNHLAAHPTDVRAIKFAADLGLRNGRWSDFEAQLEQCLKLAPDYLAARFRYATMLFAYRHFDRSLPHIEELLKSDPNDRLYRTLRVLVRGRNPNIGITAFEEIMNDAEQRPGLWMLYARALVAMRNSGAVAAHKRAMSLLPSYADAYLSLTNLKSCRLDEEAVAPIRPLLAGPHLLPAEDRAKLLYVLGKAAEDSERYAEAFENYRASNEILKGAARSGIAKSNANLQDKTLFTPAFFASRKDFGCQESGPVFIVGMPRAGSTLLEQILACHSSVEALGELTALRDAYKRIASDRGDRSQGYPSRLQDFDAERFRLLGEEYFKLMEPQRRLRKPFFTDKLPGNFGNIGLIHLALPNAKIIDVRRHPMACCFSCYKHYFPSGPPHTLDQRDMARFYADYVELMAHFDQVLPGRVYRVIYENLVGDFEAEVRRLLAWLGLPFEDACLNFHNNRRMVLTLSFDQVGRPLYASGIDHWRHFEPWLGPMKEELGPVLEKYPEVPAF